MRKVLSVMLFSLLLSLGLIGTASAAAPDVTAVVTEIGGTSVPIAAIGAAVLLVVIGVKVWKWIRSAT